MGNLAGTITVKPVTSGEGILAEILADVMKAEQVAFDSHFFDDLGADSLLMAKFCARVRKRKDLPPVSIQDIYAHPTIRTLAESLGIAEAEAEVNLDAIPTLIQPRDPILARPAAPASTRQYLTCGALQLLFFLGYAWAAALVGAWAYEWISAAKGYEEIYLRSVVFGGAASSSCAPFRSWPSGCSSAGGSPSRSASGVWSTSASGSSRPWSGRTPWHS
jgi:hypothetical protein